MSTSLAVRIYKKYGNASVSVVREAVPASDLTAPQVPAVHLPPFY